MFPALLLGLAPAAPAPVSELSVPPGFTVKLVADHAIAPDIYTMTVDDDGRVLVAGRGYVRVLADDDGDGVADRGIDLIDGMKDGPMGLLAEGDSLFVVVDGGLKRYRGYDGKSKFKGPPETLLALKTTGEHDAHAIRRGPDGWLYLMCGNMAGVTKQTITTPRSPVRDPVAGTLLRLSPDLSGGREPLAIECVADGFRNAYSFDFNPNGEPFTYDSDNERCVGLPWYEPCRFYHVVLGGNYGWRSPQLGQFWRKPPYFIDCVPPVCYLGRGSPTGVACYRHTHFPEKYRGGFFLADWTFGRIHFVPLKPKHSTYEGTPEVFAEAQGTSGFAPTALAVHPKTGELLVSIGGRGTRGGVYRIAHEKNEAGKPIAMAKRSLEWTVADGKRWLADCTGDDSRLRRTTLELMLHAREKMGWSAKLTDAVKPNLSHPDPLVRLAAARCVGPLAVPVGTVTNSQSRVVLALVEASANPRAAVQTAIEILEDSKSSDGLRLDSLRVIQLAGGDLTSRASVGTVLEGYAPRGGPLLTAERDRIATALLVDHTRSRNPDLRREAIRTPAVVATDGWGADVFYECFRRIDENTDVRDDLHILAAVSRFSRPKLQPVSEELARRLIDLDRKAAEQKVPRDAFWPLRVREIAAALAEQVPTLPATVISDPAFGRPEHVLLVEALGIDREKAAKRFLARAATESKFTWTPGSVELLGALSDEVAEHVLEKLWEKPELQSSVIKALATRPGRGDPDHFLVGLGAIDPEVVRLSAVALPELRPRQSAAELAAAVKALRRLSPEDKAARAAVTALLQHRTGKKFVADPKVWTEWVNKNSEEGAKLLAANDGFDAAAWKKREAGIAWDSGDATRGRAAFVKASCAACHDGGRSLGPSLLGVAKRFGRDDLLTAILQPGKDVSARYRPTRVTTTDETVHVGVLIYEAQDGIILQTAADSAVRIAGAEIASKRLVDASFMPASLLDKLSDAEIADLFAYLKSLEEPK